MRIACAGSMIGLLILSACNGPDAPLSPTTPTAVAPAPVAPGPIQAVNLANWRGDATVLSRSGNGGCGWGATAGEQRSGVLWRVTFNGQSIALDEDMSNWPTDHIAFSGTLSGLDFEARYYQGDDYAHWRCQFREAKLIGSFESDYSRFDAVETLVWGEPGHETVVQRRWSASRMR